jgi:hypothetical protein
VLASARPTLETATAVEEPSSRLRVIAPSTGAAVGAVLAWFAVQLGQFVGEAPDLDAMISLRESIVFHRTGLKGLIADRVGTGVHPPLMDTLNSIFFSVFGEDPRSQQLIAILLFAVLAAAVERLLAPWLSTGLRVASAFAVAICPALAVVMFTVSREGLVLVLLAVSLAIALAPGEFDQRRMLVLGGVLALLPLTKDACLVLVAPFGVYAAFTGAPAWRERLGRAASVMALPILVAVLWRIVLKLYGGHAWDTWVTSSKADDGPFVVAVRAMFGMEKGLVLRQNLANAWIVNYLWLPALLALATLVLVWRRPATAAMQRALALIGGLAAMFAWTTLTFPTFTVPRYATPLILLTLLIVLVGLPLWPRRARPFVVGALILVFLLGAWSPTDPISRKLFHTTSVGGEQIYDTAQFDRGPDRMVINFAALRASERMNARLRRVFASGVTMVTGDCDSMKFGEKLFSVGFQPSVYDRGIPGARPIRCVRPNELPPGAANGPDKIGLVRTVEEDAANAPPAVTGKSVVVIH